VKLTVETHSGNGDSRRTSYPLYLGVVYEIDDAHRLVWRTVLNEFVNHALGVEQQTAVFYLDGVPFETLTLTRDRHPVAFHPARIEPAATEAPAEPSVVSELTEQAA